MTLRAEWRKLTALRGTTWALVALLALTVLLSVLVSAGQQAQDCPPCDDDVVQIALGGVYLGQMAAAAFGVLAMSSEFTSGMIRATFAATPRRGRVLAAKAFVVGVLVLAVALVACLIGYVLGLTLLSANGYTAANGYPGPTLGESVRGVVGTAVYLAALALLGLGIGALLRGTAAALSTVFALLWVPLIVVSMMPMESGLKIARLAPMLTGLAIQRTVERDDSIPISPGAGLALFCAYAALALGLGLWRLTRHDA